MISQEDVCVCWAGPSRRFNTRWTPAPGGCDRTVEWGIFILTTPRFGKLLCTMESWALKCTDPRPCRSSSHHVVSSKRPRLPEQTTGQLEGTILRCPDSKLVPRIPSVTEGIKFTEKQVRGLCQGVQLEQLLEDTYRFRHTRPLNQAKLLSSTCRPTVHPCLLSHTVYCVYVCVCIYIFMFKYGDSLWLRQ